VEHFARPREPASRLLIRGIEMRNLFFKLHAACVALHRRLLVQRTRQLTVEALVGADDGWKALVSLLGLMLVVTQGEFGLKVLKACLSHWKFVSLAPTTLGMVDVAMTLGLGRHRGAWQPESGRCGVVIPQLRWKHWVWWIWR